MRNGPRVIIYIDGSNLFHRLKESGRRPYPFPPKLITIAKELSQVVEDDAGNPLNGSLVDILYCTAPLDGTRRTPRRFKDCKDEHERFLWRLKKADSGIRVREGRRKRDQRECPGCGTTFETEVEKGVDLRIAVECVADGMLRACDVALLFTHDTDFRELVLVMQNRIEIETKIAYLETPKSGRPDWLISATKSKSGIRIDRAPSFDYTFSRNR